MSHGNVLINFVQGVVAARLLGVHPQTVISFANSGRLPHVRLAGQGMRLYYLPDIQALAAKIKNKRRRRND